jgi:hypothetical protein
MLSDKRLLLAVAALSTLCAAPAALAHIATYNVVTTWFEPDTQPKNTIFTGTFSFDEHDKVVSNLQGYLTESMTGAGVPSPPYYDMTQLNLAHQLVSWHDSSLGGTFAATFRNANSNTFYTGLGGDGWSPQAGIAVGGLYYGWPQSRNNPGNAYALIFVPDNPTAPLTQAQTNMLAYADCAPGGMMGAVCMTGTSLAYGSVGTMSGYPLSQTIAAVPEPETYALVLAGLVLTGFMSMRRRGG